MSLNAEKLIKTEDLISLFNVSKSSVRRLIEKRQLPFYKIGGSLRFKKSDIDQYLEASRIKPIE